MIALIAFVSIASISPDGKEISRWSVPFSTKNGAVIGRKDARGEFTPQRCKNNSESGVFDVTRQVAAGTVQPSKGWFVVDGKLPEGAIQALEKHFAEDAGRPGWRLATEAEMASMVSVADIDKEFRAEASARVAGFFGRAPAGTAPSRVAEVAAEVTAEVVTLKARVAELEGELAQYHAEKAEKEALEARKVLIAEITESVKASILGEANETIARLTKELADAKAAPPTLDAETVEALRLFAASNKKQVRTGTAG